MPDDNLKRRRKILNEFETLRDAFNYPIGILRCKRGAKLHPQDTLNERADHGDTDSCTESAEEKGARCGYGLICC